MFNNRTDAAEQLVPLLAKYRNSNAMVLAVPRGGVPVGAIIARELGLPLTIILSKKIGHPSNPEYAIGAVSSNNVYIDAKHTDVSEDYIKTESERIRKDLSQRHLKFTGSSREPEVKGKTVILVDDGIATGQTLFACIDLLRKQHPQRIVVAVPVAPKETARKVQQTADEFVCVATPEPFFAIGEFYRDFSQVEDAEVIRLLKQDTC